MNQLLSKINDRTAVIGIIGMDYVGLLKFVEWYHGTYDK